MIARARERRGPTRAAALRALEKLEPRGAGELAAELATDPESAVRRAAVAVVNRVDPARALGVLDRLVADAPRDEQQNALTVLGDSPLPAADAILARWLEVAARGELPAALHLDLLEAAGKRRGQQVAAALARYDATRPPADPLAAFREALHGGDRGKGNDVFWNHEAAVCTRCHVLNGSGGNAGPALDGVGDRLRREQILEALVLPQARVADGFGTVVVTRKDGSHVAGVLRAESGGVLEILSTEGDVVQVPAAEVQARTDPVSTMPPVAAILSKRQLRDVVEFLAQEKAERRR
jgi:putative heme-binding domain-containing protein